MFSLEKAAKVLVHAWDKKWTLRHYVEVIYGGGDLVPSVEQISLDFPWLPGRERWYLSNHGQGVRIRQLIAMLSYALSDRMFEVCGERRGELFREIMELRSVDVVMTGGRRASAKNRMVQKGQSRSTKPKPPRTISDGMFTWIRRQGE